MAHLFSEFPISFLAFEYKLLCCCQDTASENAVTGAWCIPTSMQPMSNLIWADYFKSVNFLILL